MMAEARRLQNNDSRVPTTLARLGIHDVPPSELRLIDQRTAIYVRELGGTAALLAALLAIAPLSRRRGFFATALVVLTAVDLLYFARLRPIDFGPVRSLVDQSPVLKRLSLLPTHSRTIDPAHNLPMVPGAAPLLAYRTLDLPALTPLTRLASVPPERSAPELRPMIGAALRATGASMRVVDPFETAAQRPAGERVRDPALAGWLYGVDWIDEQGERAATFTLALPPAPAAMAWLVPLTHDEPEFLRKLMTLGEPREILGVLERAKPINLLAADRPERLRLTIDADGPALVIVTQLADPQWTATWSGAGGTRPARIAPVFTRPREYGWQAVMVPGPGHWTLRLDYRADDVRLGLVVSGVSWLIYLGLALGIGLQQKQR